MALKKWGAISLLLFSCLFGTVCFTSCDGGNGQTQNVISLSDVETQVYNAVKNTLPSFKHPGSVTVVSVGRKELIGRYVKISAMNSFGGYTTEIYNIMGGQLNETDGVSSFSVDSDVSVSKINSKLSDYKKSQGWI